MTPSWAAGAGLLLRYALRRDRVRLPVVVVVLAGTAALSSAATAALYPAAAEQIAAVGAIGSSPALLAVYGPLTGGSLGALALWKLGVSGAVVAAVVAVLTVVRHTRAEEDCGRAELVCSAPVGRHAPAMSALLTAGGFALALAMTTGVALAVTSVPWADALAFGAAWGAAAVAFAPVGLVAAEAAGSARVATTSAVAVVFASYLVRAIGDAAGGGRAWLVALSPVGWAELVEPFGRHRWWWLAASLGLALVCTAVAGSLRARRDFGVGWLPARPGPSRASRLLHRPVGLVWRRTRGSFAAWAVGFVLLGALCGSVTSQLGGLLDSPQMQRVVAGLGGRQAVSDAFLAAEFGLLAGVASVVVAAAVLRAADDERSGRADAVLATPVSRARWLLAQLAVAVVGGVLLMTGAGLAAGVARGAGVGHLWPDVGQCLVAALAQTPAVVLVASVALALYGLTRRAAIGVWLVVAGFILVAELGPVLGASPWILDLSPFTHVAHLPGGVYDPVAAAWIVVVSIWFALVGVAAFRRRDIA